MRWTDLFADLEGQWDASGDAEFHAEVAERTRSERADVTLAMRLSGSRGQQVTVQLVHGEPVTGTIEQAAATWMVLEAARVTWVIPLASVVSVSLGTPRAAALTVAQERLSLGHVLRAFAASRTPVTVVTSAGRWPGHVAAVGADHLDIAVAGEAAQVRAVPFGAIIAVHT